MIRNRVAVLFAGAVFLAPALAYSAPVWDAAIHVDLSHVNPKLSCDAVGQRTQVRFDARALEFRPKRVAVLLNGEPAPSDRVRYQWPEVTLDGGLLAGRNTVELIAARKDGTSVERSIIIKIGHSVQSDDGITLGCTGVADASAAVVSTPATYPSVTYMEPTARVVQPVIVTAAPSYYGYGNYGYTYPSYGGYGWDWGAYAPVVAPTIALGFGFNWGHNWGGWHQHHWHGGSQRARGRHHGGHGSWHGGHHH